MLSVIITKIQNHNTSYILLSKLHYKLSPSLTILLSFIIIIIIGTALLHTTWATETGSISFIDALFTATSAVCVTGLTVVDTGSFFTTFGKIVILCLIQVGGLGVMTISVGLFRWMGRNITYKQRSIMQNLFANGPTEHIFDLVKSVLFFTAMVELVGAGILILFWIQEFPIRKAIFYGIFHAVSAFCNAGFSFFPDSFVRYQGNIILNVTVCALIIVGGIGFPVLYDLKLFIKNKRSEIKYRLSINTITVLITTSILIGIGTLLFAISEKELLLNNHNFQLKQLLIPLFQSITARTAGFNTVDIGSLRDSTLFLLILLMFIGASPGSCGGGIKTTTAAIIVCLGINRIRSNKRVNLFKKSVPQECIDRSTSIVLLALFFIVLVLFMVLLDSNPTLDVQNGRRFLQILFETVSAFGTVGLSMGITSTLSPWSKSWIILMMIIGRVGILTFAYSVLGNNTKNGLVYSEEKLMVG